MWLTRAMRHGDNAAASFVALPVHAAGLQEAGKLKFLGVHTKLRSRCRQVVTPSVAGVPKLRWKRSARTPCVYRCHSAKCYSAHK